ncbi:MAG: hypothetical protein C0598_05120 [Marinilabiliales bacterium]|nr:MAG: hypothetical protein C0598_05120 [Marinilabiliales bacterium]
MEFFNLLMVYNDIMLLIKKIKNYLMLIFQIAIYKVNYLTLSKFINIIHVKKFKLRIIKLLDY